MLLTDVGLLCLTTRGVAVFGGALSDSTEQTFARFRRYVQPLSLRLSQLVVNYAAGMQGVGFLLATPNVGLLTFDDARLARATAQLRPARRGRWVL
ncbi:MAG: hypothetical protein JWN87_2016 [Frankiales bacterium]|nr:hypothetical protein [Frankiales bacterium]